MLAAAYLWADDRDRSEAQGRTIPGSSRGCEKSRAGKAHVVWVVLSSWIWACTTEMDKAYAGRAVGSQSVIGTCLDIGFIMYSCGNCRAVYGCSATLPFPGSNVFRMILCVLSDHSGVMPLALDLYLCFHRRSQPLASSQATIACL